MRGWNGVQSRGNIQCAARNFETCSMHLRCVFLSLVVLSLFHRCCCVMGREWKCQRLQRVQTEQYCTSRGVSFSRFGERLQYKEVTKVVVCVHGTTHLPWYSDA